MDVLFVCLGNICRSPMAEGIMKRIYRERGLKGRIESAGCGGWHVGEGADPRAVKIAGRGGVDLSAHRARKVRASDFREFDVIFAMDSDNEAHLRSIAPPDCARKIKLLRAAAGDEASACDVPDPYEHDEAVFDQVFKLLERCCARVAAASAHPPTL